MTEVFMIKDRKSACDAASLVEGGIAQAGINNTKLDQFSADAVHLQYQLSGNRCSHDKDKIKVSKVYGETGLSNRRPHVIEEFGRRLHYLARRLRSGITRADMRQERAKEFGMLYWFVSLFEDTRFLQLIYHRSNGGYARKCRSERIESTIFLVLGVLIYELSLHRMAVGRYTGGSNFLYYDYGHLAKRAGISLSRFKRAMAILKSLGLVNVKPICKTLNDGHRVTIETQITVSEEVFSIFGIEEEFLKDRRYAESKRRTVKSRSFKKETKKNIPNLDFKNIANSLKPSDEYNPTTDKEVLSLASQLLRTNLCGNIRDAITLSCTRLGKPPPN